MYGSRIQIIAIIGSVFLILFILLLIRKKRLKEEYSILWLFFGLIFLILSVWRSSIDFIADLVGIAYPPAALLLILLMGMFAIMIEFSLIISQVSDLNRSLAQDVGILKDELDEFKKVLKKIDEKEYRKLKKKKKPPIDTTLDKT